MSWQEILDEKAWIANIADVIPHEITNENYFRS